MVSCQHERARSEKLLITLQTVELTNILRCTVLFEQGALASSRNGPMSPFGCIECLHLGVSGLGCIGVLTLGSF
jgi:hypothetical protein